MWWTTNLRPCWTPTGPGPTESSQSPADWRRLLSTIFWTIWLYLSCQNKINIVTILSPASWVTLAVVGWATVAPVESCPWCCRQCRPPPPGLDILAAKPDEVLPQLPLGQLPLGRLAKLRMAAGLPRGRLSSPCFQNRCLLNYSCRSNVTKHFKHISVLLRAGAVLVVCDKKNQ